jgi:hypothetical protein
VTFRRAAVWAGVAGAIPAVAGAQRVAPTVLRQSAGVEAAAGRAPVYGARVAGQLVVGTYAGLGGYFIGRLVGTRIADLVGASDRDAANAGAVSGVVGAAFATAGTVYGIGAIGDQTGGFGATLAGTGAGYLVSIAVNALVFRDGPVTTTGAARARWLYTGLEGFLPALGATIGFTSTRRFDAQR